MPLDVSAPDSGRSTPTLIVPLLAFPPALFAVPHAASATLATASPASNFGNLIPSSLNVLVIRPAPEGPKA